MQEVDKNIGNPNVLEIAPIGKGKRTLLFFADFFLSFIAAFFLFNVAVAPLGYLITNYEAKGEESATYEHMKLDILYGHKLLYFHEIDDKYYFPESLEFTYDVFLSYFCFDDENAGIINYPEFGHKKENDVIWTYFHDIKMTNSKYFTLFSTYANIEEESSFFVRQGDEFVLKPIYKDELVTHFDESADMSKIGKQYYDDIGENIFFNLYAEIITGIQRTNLSYSGIELSYNEAAKIAQKFEVFRQDYFTYSSIIAYFIAWLVYFFIIPLCRQKHQTLGMLLMKIQRINVHRLKLYSRVESAIGSVYPLLTGALICFFLPMTVMGVAFSFSLSMLIYLSMCSLALQIISVIFMIFNGYNRTITDWCSQSVCVTTENLDAIYSIEEYNKKQ